MLCSKCFETINQDEEIQTENSAMICKECAEKATTDCYTCGNKIPQNKHVYESSREWNKKFNV